MKNISKRELGLIVLGLILVLGAGLLVSRTISPEQGGVGVIAAGNPPVQEVLVLARLLQEIPRSMDQMKKLDEKGFCGFDHRELSAIMRALHAKVDGEQINQESLLDVLSQAPSCDSSCLESLCETPLFKSLVREREKYGIDSNAL